MRHADNKAGFTLVEIMVAVAILGGAMLILLDAHYGALSLSSETRESVLLQEFLEKALGEAEVQVMAGQLSGAGDFGKTYPEYSYTFTAQAMGEQYVPIFTVMVSVTGPIESKEMQMLVYTMAPTQ